MVREIYKWSLGFPWTFGDQFLSDYEQLMRGAGRSFRRADLLTSKEARKILEAGKWYEFPPNSQTYNTTHCMHEFGSHPGHPFRKLLSSKAAPKEIVLVAIDSEQLQELGISCQKILQDKTVVIDSIRPESAKQLDFLGPQLKQDRKSGLVKIRDTKFLCGYGGCCVKTGLTYDLRDNALLSWEIREGSAAGINNAGEEPSNFRFYFSLDGLLSRAFGKDYEAAAKYIEEQGLTGKIKDPEPMPSSRRKPIPGASRRHPFDPPDGQSR